MNTLIERLTDYLKIGGSILLVSLVITAFGSFIRHLISLIRYKTLDLRISKALKERNFDNEN